jgi:hypothetical protein
VGGWRWLLALSLGEMPLHAWLMGLIDKPMHLAYCDMHTCRWYIILSQVLIVPVFWWC